MKARPVSDLPSALCDDRPRLVYFYGRTSGPSRRIEGYLSQVLQRRQNHETFQVIRVCVDTNAQLVSRFGIGRIPALIVIDKGNVQARVDGPRGRADIEDTLAPWLH